MKFDPSYIADVLFEHNCLILPGLGAFISNEVAAQIDKKRGIMLPPRKEVLFNQSLKHNDGFLASEIVRRMNVGIEEANDMVVSYVDMLKQQLASNGKANIEGVGVLRTIGLSIIFIPDTSVNFLADSYGFSVLPVCEQRERLISLPRTSGQIRRIAASAAMLIGMVLIGSETIDTEVSKQYSQANIIASVLDGQHAVAAETESEAETEEVIAEMPSYHIIVGSFPNKAEADEYVETMKKRGVDGLEILNSDNRFRVSAASFATHDEAVKQNRIVRKIQGFSKAWILCAK